MIIQLKKIIYLLEKIRTEIVCTHLKIPKSRVNFIDHATGHSAYAYFAKRKNLKIL